MTNPISKKRIGVFVCHCGLNIAQAVDVKKVVEVLRTYPDVVHAEDYLYMCSEPGQDIIRSAIKKHKLNAIVNANCSPSLHEKTFRRLCEAEGLNPYCQEVANIREHCSWPHAGDRETATAKAIAITRATIDRLRLNMELQPAKISLNKRVMVIGAGVAGMQAALRIARGGYEVVLVEKEPSIGGHVTQLACTFPDFDNARQLIEPLMQQVVAHPRIKLYAYAEIDDVAGYVGNFNVQIRQKAAGVNAEACSGCGACFNVCPVEVPSEFECGLSKRPAIYRPFSGALPQRPVIDKSACLHFVSGECSACNEACPEQAVVFEQEDALVEEQVGAVIIATGYDLIERDVAGEYAGDPDVIDGLQFERLLDEQGPTGGRVLRPSDGREAREIVFIQCVGSRDPEHAKSYCSRVCCLYTAKQTAMYRSKVPEGQAYVFFMDVRSDVKGTEEFVKEVVETSETLYLRGRVSKVFRDGEQLTVWGVDTLTGKSIEIRADMVVLATAVVPRPDARELARTLNVISDQNGFFTEAHLKLRPVDTLTAGMYLAGACQWPKDIPDTISSASAAASRILSLFARRELLHEPTIAFVDEELCVGCGQCVSLCAYKAITLDEKRQLAYVNEAICEGCGACAVTCPSKAMQHKNWTPKQFLNMVDVLTQEYEK
ncbi:MAG: CoB--CoM heterodisulfide reductase iron-sulfur subunit A family protein [Deltaproteobacteria bacterium]|nr:CoB--CoM heterodisulfide reductase iron-sulfur subunit A family protein [Deltaproteobacteria bacterium]